MERCGPQFYTTLKDKDDTHLPQMTASIPEGISQLQTPLQLQNHQYYSFFYVISGSVSVYDMSTLRKDQVGC